MAKDSLWILLLLVIVAVSRLDLVESDPLQAIYIFGDSTMDVGTNNHLKDSLARSDMPFNGIDFPFSQPTGRFSNGHNTADLIVRLFGENRSPSPFLTLLSHQSTFKADIMKGVNFASGGSGILKETGNYTLKEVVPLEVQIDQFSTVCSNITQLLGSDKGNSLINSSLYIISVGSNDFFDYQRLNLSASIPRDALLASLHQTYARQLKRLYCLGARKFGIVSVPPIGCCPFERAVYGGGECVDDMNAFALDFYELTRSMLENLSRKFPDFEYSLGNAYNMTMTMLNNPILFGIREAKTACCGQGKFNGEVPCNKSASLCPDRKEYLFWDMFHPTQAVSQLAALTLYGGSQPFVAPMNFSRLAGVV
ncbi:GDSL esterase/lipase At4g28780-like [Impatiens glandulifera]|uniref:GDSL esterase/lipase At4g28780-like n=1 Tax=Impatiens glandulifera TaxID=253017 RepID=UPI001FB0F751|nr:GDSL esterase/lipase At4g28780-like [Impatiens glandulifera]